MITSWIGILLGFAGILVGQFLEGGNLGQLLQPTAALIVFGGTLGATMLSSTLKEFSEAIRGVPRIFFAKPPDPAPVIKQIVSLAVVARREGILALERMLPDIKRVPVE